MTATLTLKEEPMTDEPTTSEPATALPVSQRPGNVSVFRSIARSRSRTA